MDPYFYSKSRLLKGRQLALQREVSVFLSLQLRVLTLNKGDSIISKRIRVRLSPPQSGLKVFLFGWGESAEQYECRHRTLNLHSAHSFL